MGLPQTQKGTDLSICPQQKLQNQNQVVTPASCTGTGASLQGAVAATGPVDPAVPLPPVAYSKRGTEISETHRPW